MIYSPCFLYLLTTWWKLSLPCRVSVQVEVCCMAWMGKGRDRPLPVSVGSFLTPQSRGPLRGSLGDSGCGAELGDVQLWVSPLCGRGGETGTSSKLRWGAPGPGRSMGELFFVPGEGYSLSLRAVIIAGGGSGLNFLTDALRSRQLVLQAV